MIKQVTAVGGDEVCRSTGAWRLPSRNVPIGKLRGSYTDADNKAVDADAALQELGDDLVAFGYITTSVTVHDEDSYAADEKIRVVERAINSRGFTTIRENVNAVEAWLGSLPGQAYANLRQPIVHTLNLAHMCPLSAVWVALELSPILVAGDERHLLDWQSCLEQTARSLVAQIVEVQVFDLEACPGECRTYGSMVMRKDPPIASSHNPLLKHDLPCIIAR